MKNTKENDMRILTALYNGTHLNNDELERANKLIFLLTIDYNMRVKK